MRTEPIKLDVDPPATGDDGGGGCDGGGGRDGGGCGGGLRWMRPRRAAFGLRLARVQVGGNGGLPHSDNEI